MTLKTPNLGEQPKRIVDSVQRTAEEPGMRHMADMGFAYELGMLQIRTELELLRCLLERMSCDERIGLIEIGSCFGGTLYIWLSHFSGQMISIDLPEGPGCCGNTKDSMERRNVILRRKANNWNHLHFIFGDSTEQQVCHEVESILHDTRDRRVGMLFIDGDHRYEFVKIDYETFSPCVREGGVIVLHDIKPECRSVHQLWGEIVESGVRCLEICDPRYSWGGLGVVFK